MPFGFLKKIFGSSSNTPTDTKKENTIPKRKDGKVEADIVEFVKFVVKSLVDAPEKVSVETVENGNIERIQITCEKGDVGKVIGKSGKTIASIRALANGAAGRLGKKISVEVLD